MKPGWLVPLAASLAVVGAALACAVTAILGVTLAGRWRRRGRMQEGSSRGQQLEGSGSSSSAEKYIKAWPMVVYGQQGPDYEQPAAAGLGVVKLLITNGEGGDTNGDIDSARRLVPAAASAAGVAAAAAACCGANNAAKGAAAAAAAVASSSDEGASSDAFPPTAPPARSTSAAACIPQQSTSTNSCCNSTTTASCSSSVLALANRAALAHTLASSPVLFSGASAAATDPVKGHPHLGHDEKMACGGRSGSGGIAAGLWRAGADDAVAAAAVAAAPPQVDDGDFLKALNAYFRNSELQLWSSDVQQPASGGAAAAEASAAAPGGGAAVPNARGTAVAAPREMADAIKAVQAELRDPELLFEGVIASGAFGVVYRGQWRGLPVAQQQQGLAAGGKEARAQQRAVLEAAISMSMTHRHVVATYSYDIKPLVPAPATRDHTEHAAQATAAPAAAADSLVDVTEAVAPPPGAENTATTGGRPAAAAAAGGPAGALADASIASSDVIKLYIVQEYCNGGTLRDALDRGVAGSVRAGGLAGLLARRLALDVALGMRHIHSCRIVHGDLKPENVLLVWGSRCGGSEAAVAAGVLCVEAEGGIDESAAAAMQQQEQQQQLIAKVADFGLSTPLTEGATHASRRFHGTPLYRAPEVESEGRLSPRADVWCFGLMLIELYFGCSIGDVLETGAAVLGRAARYEDWLQRPGHAFLKAIFSAVLADPPYTDLVERCLSQQPSDRPDFEEIVTRLQAMGGA
ncbi:hypothetical protein PLESTF_001659900 [Pleodorina starrii]|nr:hypothetical protein PLESTF_001659900 [Pleodorina starrii]